MVIEIKEGLAGHVFITRDERAVGVVLTRNVIERVADLRIETTDVDLAHELFTRWITSLDLVGCSNTLWEVVKDEVMTLDTLQSEGPGCSVGWLGSHSYRLL
jgi:hypothetical protein